MLIAVLLLSCKLKANKNAADIKSAAFSHKLIIIKLDNLNRALFSAGAATGTL